MPGRTLATQREAMGWSVEQVADQLKLAVRQVVALEAGDYASLPSPAVTRGFVRAYAKILKLDPVPLVAMIEMDVPAPSEGERVIRHRPASFSEVRFPSHGKRPALPLGWIAGAVLVLVAGVLTWKFDLIPSASRSAAPAITEQTAVLAPTTTGSAPAAGGAATQDTLINPSVPLISVPPPVAPEGAASTSAGTPAGVGPVAGVGPAAGQATAPAAAPAPGANALVITVREDSWVEVRAGRKKLMGRMVKAGSTETVDVTEPLTVTVGKPAAVSATLRGAAVELPTVPGKTFARVTLK
ncbi:MAG TPA: RodZ domain-containing protein [Telluria sp.]